MHHNVPFPQYVEVGAICVYTFDTLCIEQRWLLGNFKGIPAKMIQVDFKWKLILNGEEQAKHDWNLTVISGAIGVSMINIMRIPH